LNELFRDVWSVPSVSIVDHVPPLMPMVIPRDNPVWDFPLPVVRPNRKKAMLLIRLEQLLDQRPSSKSVKLDNNASPEISHCVMPHSCIRSVM
jgi:hypothetical protein